MKIKLVTIGVFILDLSYKEASVSTGHCISKRLTEKALSFPRRYCFLRLKLKFSNGMKLYVGFAFEFLGVLSERFTHLQDTYGCVKF